MLTQARLKELLHYDPLTGEFTYKVGRGRIKAGSKAGSPTKSGYTKITVDGKTYQAHRLAWLYVCGALPAKALDHANCVRTDNRIANLRQATPLENSHNRAGANSNNQSGGLLGVSWSKPLQKYYARITFAGKHKSLGVFTTAEEAHQAYLTAKRELHSTGVSA